LPVIVSPMIVAVKVTVILNGEVSSALKLSRFLSPDRPGSARHRKFRSQLFRWY